MKVISNKRKKHLKLKRKLEIINLIKSINNTIESIRLASKDKPSSNEILINILKVES